MIASRSHADTSKRIIMRLFRRAACAIGAAVIIAGLTACGGVHTPPATQATQPAAVKHNYKAAEFMDTIRTAMKTGLSARMAITTAATDTVPAMSIDAALVLDNGDGKPAMDMTTEASGTKISLRLVGGQMYIGTPQTAGKYVHVDLSDSSNPLSAMADSMSAMDPASQAAELRSAVTAIHYVGDVTLSGTSTSHYTVTVDPSKLTGALGKQMGTLVDHPITYDYWIDRQRLPVKIVTDTPIQGQDIRMTVLLSDWGKVGRIAAPTADQIISPDGS